MGVEKNILEDEDLKFEELLQQKRHKEIIDLLKAIPNSLNKGNQSQQIAQAISKNTEVVNGLIDKIANIKIESPQVTVPPSTITVQSNQDKVVEEIRQLKEGIKNMSELLETQNGYLEQMLIPKQWDFEVKKDGFGRLTGVMATPILFRKIKAQA